VDMRQLIESLVSSLAWPVAAVAIAFVYRPLLVRWLRGRAAVSATEPEPSPSFSAFLARTSQQLLESGIVRPASATEVDRHEEEIEAFSSLSASGAVVEGHTLVHKALQRLVYGAGPRSDGAEAPTMVLARSARNSGLIDDDMVSAIERLTFLRGLATNLGGGEVDMMGALNYLCECQPKRGPA